MTSRFEEGHSSSLWGYRRPSRVLQPGGRMPDLYTVTALTETNDLVTVVLADLDEVGDTLIEQFGYPGRRYEYTATPAGIDALVVVIAAEVNATVEWGVHVDPRWSGSGETTPSTPVQRGFIIQPRAAGVRR